MKLVVFGLSLSSSWGNGHATTYRALLRAFASRGHDIVFFEREVAWYAAHRDLARPSFCDLVYYESLADLTQHRRTIADADAVMIGSYVPDGIEIGRLVQGAARGATAFYDIDTPVTLRLLANGACPYVSPELIRGYRTYLSFTGGPALVVLEDRFGARRASALYCSVDPQIYKPSGESKCWDLSYIGTYSDDRQPMLDELLVKTARALPDRRFVVAGPMYPPNIQWPANIERMEHVPPASHAAFYGASRYTLNVTRADMVAAGWSPSVRLFEAAACGVSIISDRWPGLDSLFAPDREIILAERTQTVVAALMGHHDVGAAGRARVLGEHTAAHRACELERHLTEALASCGEASRARMSVGSPAPERAHA